MKGFSIQAFWTCWCMHTRFFLAAGNTRGGLAGIAFLPAHKSHSLARETECVMGQGSGHGF